MKILVMGLSGAGKTWIAKRLAKELDLTWHNADKIREATDDWDFSLGGRLRQAIRMSSREGVLDFICPLEEFRNIVEPDITIFIDTIEECVFHDTNKIFQRPNNPDFVVDHHYTENELKELADRIRGHECYSPKNTESQQKK